MPVPEWAAHLHQWVKFDGRLGFLTLTLSPEIVRLLSCVTVGIYSELEMFVTGVVSPQRGPAYQPGASEAANASERRPRTPGRNHDHCPERATQVDSECHGDQFQTYLSSIWIPGVVNQMEQVFHKGL